MKKLIVALCASAMLLGGCNKQLVDTTYSFDYAIIKMPTGLPEIVEIKSWTDFEDGDQIQIIAENGTVYLVHSMNCTLVKEA